MLDRGATLIERDLGKQPMSLDELRDLFGDRDPREFLNPKNELYRRKKMKEHPPSAAETLRLMASEPNLIRRPLTVRGRTIVKGFDAEALERLAR